MCKSTSCNSNCLISNSSTCLIERWNGNAFVLGSYVNRIKVSATNRRIMTMFQGFSLVLFLSLCGISYSRTSTHKQYATENLNDMKSLRNLHGEVIPMDTGKFKKLVKTKYRDYSVVVMFTALKAQYKCEVCIPAKEEFDILGFSHNAAYPHSNEMFFVIISAENANEAFQIMKLKYVPVVFIFPGTRKRTSQDKFDAMRTGYTASGMAKWLHDVGDVKIKIIKPFDFTAVIFVISALFPFVVIWLKFRDEFMKIVGNKTLWGLIVVTTVLTMTSGQMWNHIRKPPEANTHGRNGIEYINGSRGAQYLFESYIVMGVNGAIAIGFILLNEVHRFKAKVPRKIIGFLGFLVVAIFFGLLLHIFRMKSQGYPYSFLFL